MSSHCESRFLLDVQPYRRRTYQAVPPLPHHLIDHNLLLLNFLEEVLEIGVMMVMKILRWTGGGATAA